MQVRRLIQSHSVGPEDDHSMVYGGKALHTHIVSPHSKTSIVFTKDECVFWSLFCSNCKRARMTHQNSFQHTVSLTQQAVTRGFHSSFGGTTPGIKIVTWRSYVFIVLYCTVYHGIAQCQLAGAV